MYITTCTTKRSGKSIHTVYFKYGYVCKRKEKKQTSDSTHDQFLCQSKKVDYGN